MRFNIFDDKNLNNCKFNNKKLCLKNIIQIIINKNSENGKKYF